MPVSCAGKEDPDNSDDRSYTIEAIIEQPYADISSEASGFALTWPENASLYLLQKKSVIRPGYVGTVADKLLYRLKSGAGSPKGTFVSDRINTDKIYCYYPSGPVSSGETDEIAIPMGQQYVPDGISIDSYPMYALADELSDGLAFKPFMAILQIAVTGRCSLLEIDLECPRMPLSGRATLDNRTGSIAFKDRAQQGPVIISFENPLALSDTPTVINVAVPPGEGQDYTIVLHSSRYGMLKKTCHRQTFRAGEIRRIASLDFGDGSDNFEGLGPGITIAGRNWAPVNCGYAEDLPLGSLYQWGRLYGQPYELGDMEPFQMWDTCGSDPSYKDYFGKPYPETLNWSDWFESLYWSAYGGINNPCPKGWRLPTVDELYKLTYEDHKWVEGRSFTGNGSGDFNGYLFGSGEQKLFFPASGKRDLDGKASGLGEVAGYWSTDFDYQDIITIHTLSISKDKLERTKSALAEGLSVRCVRERDDW